MSFSDEWEQTYKAGAHISVWPWSDLVSLVMRHSRPKSSDFRVLELGFGAGANIRLFEELGVLFYGMDGSPSVVQRVSERFPQLKDRLIAGDFTKEIPFSGEFDLIVDRGSITCNPTQDIERCLKMLHAKLRTGGVFIGVDWISSEHSDRQIGTKTDDDFTYKLFPHGQYAGIGKLHFSDETHLLSLFKEFELIFLDHKTTKVHFPKANHQLATWNIVVRKS